MKNKEKYNKAFIDTFGVEAEVLNNNFSKDTVEAWDSVHQLNVVTTIEDLFGLFFDPEDIMSFVSYDAGKQVLHKYNVQID